MEAMDYSDDIRFVDGRDDAIQNKVGNHGNTTEVKPLTRRKKKVKLDPEAKSAQNLNGSIKLDSSLTEPWCGPLEVTDDPGPHPGPFNTTLFWMRHGRNLDPIPGSVHGSHPVDPKGVYPTVENHVKSSNGETYNSVGLNHTDTGVNHSSEVNHNGYKLNHRINRVSVDSSGVNHTDGTTPSSPVAPWKQGKGIKSNHIRVFLRVTFRKVGQVDTVSETFNADVIIQARWIHDETLFDTKSDTLGTTKIDWSPLLYIENTNSNIIKTQGREFWDDPYSGDRYVIQRLTARGTFTESMELDHFPFDCQNLTVTVASERSSAEITLCVDPLDPSYLHQGNFVDKQEWHLFEHVDAHEPEGYESDIAMTLTRRPALSFTCQAARKIGYFTWNVFLLLVVIFLMHLCSFSVAKTSFNPRLSSSFTMFLTAIAFKVALNQYLPRISYLTYMDSYLLIQLVLMGFVCGWHATVAHLATTELTEQIMIIIISVIYVVFQIVFVAIAYFIPGKRRREIYAKHKAHRQKLLMKTSKSTVA